MFARYLWATLSAAVAIGTTACSNSTVPARVEPTWEQAVSSPFISANYQAADALLAQIRPGLKTGQSLLMATVVSIDALDKSSTLGRLISEQVAGRFTHAGYRMVEMKFANAIYLRRDQGEMMLTREIGNLAKTHDAQAVVVGTYGEGTDFVFVNLKVIQPTTNVVLAVHDYVMPLNASTRSLLRR